jgi:hypothetical protein
MIDDGCEMLEPGDLDKPKEQLLAELARLTSRGTCSQHYACQARDGRSRLPPAG